MPKRLLLALLAYTLPVGFIVAPLVSFLAYSFFRLDHGKIDTTLTFFNYIRFFADPIFLPVLLQTCALCLGVTLLAILLGYPVAYLLASLKGRTKYTLLMLVVVPLLMSYVIKMYAIRAILGGNGLLNRFLLATGLISEPLTLFVFNLNAVLLTLTVLLVPFAILPIYLSLERIPGNLMEAAADLGASDWQAFRKVTWPHSLAGVATAASFVFVLAIGDFLTPQLVGGNSGFTFGRIIYSQFGSAFNWPFGSALSVVLSVVVITAILIGNHFGRAQAESE